MWKAVFAVCAVLSLALCLAFPVIFFMGKISGENYKLFFLFSSLAWFFFVFLWATKRRKTDKNP